jgi:hypothetical protein
MDGLKGEGGGKKGMMVRGRVGRDEWEVGEEGGR